MRIFTILAVINILILSCSSSTEETVPSYTGRYFLVKNYAIVNGVKDSESIHEGSCSGKTNYLINEDNNVNVEVYGAQSGKCSLIGNFKYNYNISTNSINGETVNFEGNILTITNVSKSPNVTIENVYIYKK
ncbi:hypothetical protein [Chryseobacterium sp. JK1]|uniref:hypothetical protein n=1 Tax=Chryseobacterium sp. JK1 TaxID=874294 RepID=UPI003D68B853